MKKLIALAAAGILTLSVAAFADEAAKTTETKTDSTTSETKKDDAGAMKKTTTKKHAHKKSVKKDDSKMEKKTDTKTTKTETTEAAPKTN